MKKKILLLILFILAILAISSVIIIIKTDIKINIPFLGNKEEIPEETKVYLDEVEKYKDFKIEKYDGTVIETKNINITAYQVNNVKDPVITAGTNTEDGYTIIVYYMKDGNLVEGKFNKSTGISAFYSIDNKSTEYYLTQANSSKKITHIISLEDYILEKNNKREYDVKFENDTKFIEVNLDTTSFNVTDGDFSKNMTNIINNIKSIDELYTEEIKSTVSAKETEIKKKQQQADYITVNGHKLKFGRYKGKMQDMLGEYYDIEVVLKDKNYIVFDGQTKKYSIKGKYIVFDGFEHFQVDSDNKMLYLAGITPTLTYQGR